MDHPGIDLFSEPSPYSITDGVHVLLRLRSRTGVPGASFGATVLIAGLELPRINQVQLAGPNSSQQDSGEVAAPHTDLGTSRVTGQLTE